MHCLYIHFALFILFDRIKEISNVSKDLLYSLFKTVKPNLLDENTEIQRE